MKDSTLDVNRVRGTPTRAIGHVDFPFRPPVDFLLIPSGGVWTTANDMTRYLQFHINKGALPGNRMLREDLAETMYAPPNLPANHYAQGIIVTTEHGTRRFEHGGGGFGFNSDMIWYPELKLGAVVLCNAQLENDFVYQLNKEILDSIIASSPDLYAQRAKSAVRVEPAYRPDKQGNILWDDALGRLIESKALPESAAGKRRVSALVGKYFLGDSSETIEISNRNNELILSLSGTTSSLTEVEPGLYFSLSGDAFDVRGPVPMFTNIRLVKANTRALPLQIAFYAICGLVFLSALFWWPIRAILRRIRRKGAETAASAADSPRNHLLTWVGLLTGLASLFSLFCLATVALIPNLIYVPWPRPYVDLLWWQFGVLSLPFACLLLAVVIALLAAPITRNYAWARTTCFYYLTVALALLTFNLAIIL